MPTAIVARHGVPEAAKCRTETVCQTLVSKAGQSEGIRLRESTRLGALQEERVGLRHRMCRYFSGLGDD